MTVKLVFGRSNGLFFLVFSVTVFCLVDFACEADVNFKGLVLAGTFRDLIGLHPFFLEVRKCGPDSLALFVGGENIDDEGELFRR